MILTNAFLFRHLGWHSGIPKDLSIGQIQTNKVPLEVGHITRFSRGYGKACIAREPDAITQDNRAGRARAGQIGFPGDVLVVAPGERRSLRIAAPMTSRPAKLRPICGMCRLTVQWWRDQMKKNKRAGESARDRPGPTLRSVDHC